MNKYDFMWRDKKIGELHEDITKFGRVLKLILYKEGKKYTRAPLELWLRAPDGIVENDIVWWWIGTRITPKTQVGIEEKLEYMGLSEYDPWNIYKFGNGMSPRDDLWVKFKPELDYKKDHPRYTSMH